MWAGFAARTRRTMWAGYTCGEAHNIAGCPPSVLTHPGLPPTSLTGVGDGWQRVVRVGLWRAPVLVVLFAFSASPRVVRVRIDPAGDVVWRLLLKRATKQSNAADRASKPISCVCVCVNEGGARHTQGGVGV